MAWWAICILSQGAAADWPHWRGPTRNDVSPETSGYRDGQWPLREVWTAELGEGSSSPIVARGRLFTMGWADGNERVYAIRAGDGEPLWMQSYPAPRYGRLATGDKGLYSGPSSTPEFDPQSQRLYTLGNDGDLICWNAADGERVWAINLHEAYTVPQRPRVNRSGLRDYGYTSSPCVIGDWLVVEVGAEQGTLIAFDKGTGVEVWRSAVRSPAGHNGGPVPLQVDGMPCLVVHHHDGLLVVGAAGEAAGATVAEYAWRTDFANNIATPAVVDNNVVLTSSYNQQKIARLRISLDRGAELVWERELASKVCSPIIHDGYVYWVWQRLYCLDFANGGTIWEGGRFTDPGSLIMTRDDRLIVWANRGDLLLVNAFRHAPTAYEPLAERLRLARDDAWPHVALAGGKIYCRDRTGRLVCFATAE